MMELHDSPHFQFLQKQISLFLIKPQGRRYTKHTLVLAVELLVYISTIYRIVCNSGAICPTHENLIRRFALACAG